MDHKSVSGAGHGATTTGTNSTMPNRPPNRHRRPKDGEGDFVDLLGEWIVSIVVFCVKSIDYTKEQVDKYWPSEESLNGIYEWVEKRPRLSSFIAIQALSIVIPVSLFLTFAFWVTLLVVSGAVMLLLGGLGLGVCFFLPIILSIMFVASLVWVWLYLVWSTGSFLWSLYTGDAASQGGKVVLADIKGEDNDYQGGEKAGHIKKVSTSGTDGPYDSSDSQSPIVPTSTSVAFKGTYNISPSGLADPPGVPPTPPPTQDRSGQQPSSAFSGTSDVFVDGLSDDTLSLGGAPSDGQMDELNMKLEESKRMMAEMEKMAPPKPGRRKQKSSDKDKVMMDIERSLG